jgi:Mn2+/Fe2+ NRAMP family transporter
LASVLAVNVLTLAADLEGGAAALSLLTGAAYQWFVLPFAVAVGALLIFGNYVRIERTLKYVALVFLAYVAAAFMARPHWDAVLLQTFVPHFSWSNDYVAGALALLGTTLTSYAYVWETIELAHERPALRRLGLVQAEAAAGMIFAGVIFWFILVTTGATLGVHHQTVQTAQDAAAALVPLAGRYAALIFGVGLLASAVLAVPVLAGTSAYVVAEMFGWRASLDAKFAHAPRFYVALMFSLAAGAAIAFAGISPIAILFYSGIAGGIGTPITLVLMMLVARDKQIMKGNVIHPSLAAGGWIVTAVVVGACAIYLYQTATGAGS